MKIWALQSNYENRHGGFFALVVLPGFDGARGVTCDEYQGYVAKFSFITV